MVNMALINSVRKIYIFRKGPVSLVLFKLCCRSVSYFHRNSVIYCSKLAKNRTFSIPATSVVEKIYKRQFSESTSDTLKSVPPQSCETVKFSIITSNNEEIEVEGNIGDTVMKVGVEKEVGMEGACEGQLACTTCHVYVEEKYFEKLPEPSDIEEDLLDSAVFPKPNSRLGCQIYLTKELEGAKFTLPSATVNFAVDKQMSKKGS